MGRSTATPIHLTLCGIAAIGYFLFIIPRWWELMGDTSHTVGTVVRVATGVFVALAALPVVLTLLRTRQPEYRTPELALRLRLWSTAAHVIAGVLIIAAAVAEIWVSLDTAGPWVYGVYGAALALVILGAAGFYLAFVADQPPAAPKEAKPKKVKKKRGKKADEASGPEETSDPEDAPRPGEPDETSNSDEASDSDAPDETAEPATAAQPAELESTAEPEPATDDSEPEPQGALRNKRPSGKSGHHLRRSARGGVAVEE